MKAVSLNEDFYKLLNLRTSFKQIDIGHDINHHLIFIQRERLNAHLFSLNILFMLPPDTGFKVFQLLN